MQDSIIFWGGRPCTSSHVNKPGIGEEGSVWLFCFCQKTLRQHDKAPLSSFKHLPRTEPPVIPSKNSNEDNNESGLEALTLSARQKRHGREQRAIQMQRTRRRPRQNWRRGPRLHRASRAACVRCSGMHEWLASQLCVRARHAAQTQTWCV